MSVRGSGSVKIYRILIKIISSSHFRKNTSGVSQMRQLKEKVNLMVWAGIFCFPVQLLTGVALSFFSNFRCLVSVKEIAFEPFTESIRTHFKLILFQVVSLWGRAFWVIGISSYFELIGHTTVGDSFMWNFDVFFIMSGVC